MEIQDLQIPLKESSIKGIKRNLRNGGWFPFLSLDKAQ
jgi:hypothetical protein